MVQEQLSELLHLPCTSDLYSGVNYLPLYLRSSYEFNEVRVEQLTFLAVHPKEKIPLSTLRKDWAALQKSTGLPCAFIFEALKPYTREKLMAEGIPFTIGTREVFLPFLGVILSTRQKNLPDVEQCSMMTQKFLLTAIYQQFRSGSAAQLADLLGVSRMSGTRCMDEIEVLFPTLIQRRGQRRFFAWEGTWKDYWQLIKPSLQSPVMQEYRLDAPMTPSLPLGGISAVCHYSMLDDGKIRTYAVTRARAAELNLPGLPQVPRDEIPAAIIQVLGYEIPFGDNIAIDPLTAALSVCAADQQDPRVEGGIQEIEERYLS
ncbi:MAG: hypothetical protein ACI4C3_06680 [Bacteroides sp.]